MTWNLSEHDLYSFICAALLLLGNLAFSSHQRLFGCSLPFIWANTQGLLCSGLPDSLHPACGSPLKVFWTLEGDSCVCVPDSLWSLMQHRRRKWFVFRSLLWSLNSLRAVSRCFLDALNLREGIQASRLNPSGVLHPWALAQWSSLACLSVCAIA